MSSADAQKQPSVEELLVSIRQAIHGDGANPLSQAVKQTVKKQVNGAPVSASMNQTRVSLQPVNGNRNTMTRKQNENFFKLRDQLQELGAEAPHAVEPPSPPATAPARPNGAANGFAGILSGDVRLEEALEKLKRAGLGTDAPAVAETAPEPEPEIRSSHYDYEDEYTDQDYTLEEAEYEEEYDYRADAQAHEPAESGFSAQTRQAYIEPTEPPHVAEQPYEETTPPQPITHAVAPVPDPVAAPQEQPPLTSDASAQAASAAFNRLADTIVGHATTGERSIDDITRELLRPMLQSWLDEHLPRLVERLVREEIERVARWGGK